MTTLYSNADIAELYLSDQNYEPGSVVEFGGEKEITEGTAASKRVAGIISTNPSQVLNGAAKGVYMLPVALVGRVPCRVVGPITKGDLLISAGFGYARSHPNPAVGQVIGKALQDHASAKGVIEVAVGRG